MDSGDLFLYLGFFTFLCRLNSGLAFNCSFDTDECGFVQSTNDQFDWTRKTGSTISPITGPKNGDHTSGSGYYMYIDVSSKASGDKAVMTKTIEATERNCLEFYYHMYAAFQTMGDLNVYVDNVRRFHLSGSQANTWMRGKVNFNFTGLHQVDFEATKKSDNVGEIAIDDIKLYTCYKPENMTLAANIKKTSNVFIVGERLEFVCQSSAKPTPCTIKFSYQGITLDKPSESKNCSIVLTWAASGCGPGRLTCEATNEEGTTVTHLDVTVQDSPSIRVQSQEYYREGDRVQIFCTAKGCPTPTLNWTKTGVDAPVNTGTGFLILEFSKITLEDAGVYQCTAQNGAPGSPVSKAVDVNVYHKPKNVELSTNRKNDVFLQGEAVNLTCKALANPASCKIVFSLEFKPLHTAINLVGCSASYVIPNIVGCGALSISCLINNPFGSVPSDVKKVFVQVPPSSLIIIPDKLFSVREGSPLTLTCSAIGCPTPMKTWTKTGVEEPLARGNQSLLTHVFASLTKDDAGYYNCSADNGAGPGPVSKSVHIDVLYTPRNTQITTNRSSDVFLQGEAVVITCQSEANPPSCSISLFRGGTLLAQQNSDTCSLNYVISSITGCNQVRFSCLAMNVAGQGETVVKTITVQVPAMIGLTPAKNVIQNEGTPLVLACSAEGCPTPNVTWSKIGSAVPLARFNGSVQLTFVALRKTDTGTYRCDADNGLIGRRATYQTIHVNVTYEPENPQLTTNKSTDVFLYGEAVEFTCRASANPPSCTLSFSRGDDILAEIASETCSAKYILPKITGCNQEEFTCIAYGSIGRGTMVKKYVTVQVPVNMTVSPVQETLVMTEGSSLDLNCSATGCPTPNITWKNARNVDPYLEVTGHVLAHNFTDVQKEQIGYHVCIVDNGIVGSPLNRSIYVNVTYGPIITTLPRQLLVTLYENDQVDFTCKVDSNPKADVIWMKEDNNHVITRGEKLKLTAEQSLAGNYSCVARNGLGLTNKASFIVTVKACHNNQCKSNTSCISQGTTYHCDCPDGLTGRLCDENDPFKAQFTITFYIVNIVWTVEYKDTGSRAFKFVEDKICLEMRRLFVAELLVCELISLSKGSVISETRLTFNQDKYRSKVIAVIKKETVNDTLGPYILDQSALITRVEPYSSFCGEQPCHFDGTCYEQEDGYRCDCKLFRFGMHCEKGIGFVPGVAVVVVASVLLIAIVFVVIYCCRKSKRGSFAKGTAEEEAKMTPKNETSPKARENHQLSSSNVVISVNQDQADKPEKTDKDDSDDPYDEATKL